MLENEYIGLYFYSAVFQGNMALLALVGVFAVYKLQQLSAKLDQIGAGLALDIKTLTGYPNSPFFNFSVNANLDRVKSDAEIFIKRTDVSRDEINNVEKVMTDPAVKAGFDLRRLTQDRIETVKKGLSVPFGLTLIVICASLTVLPFAHYVHTSMCNAELPLILSLIALNVLSLTFNTRYILAIVRHEI